MIDIFVPYWVWVTVLVVYVLFELILLGKMLIFAFDPLMLIVMIVLFIVVTAIEFIFLCLVALILPHFAVFTFQPVPHIGLVPKLEWVRT